METARKVNHLYKTVARDGTNCLMCLNQHRARSLMGLALSRLQEKCVSCSQPGRELTWPSDPEAFSIKQRAQRQRTECQRSVPVKAHTPRRVIYRGCRPTDVCRLDVHRRSCQTGARVCTQALCRHCYRGLAQSALALRGTAPAVDRSASMLLDAATPHHSVATAWLTPCDDPAMQVEEDASHAWFTLFHERSSLREKSVVQDECPIATVCEARMPTRTQVL